jgi:hypothetical protein
MTVVADAVDLSTIQILQSPDVHDWPVTAAITQIEFRPNDFRIDFTKKNGPGRWPDAVTPGWDGPLQYTIWVVLLQQKLTCGCIQMWHGKEEHQGIGVGGPFSKGAQDWWFRVTPMAGIQPGPGDRVGFFVAAGDCRLRAAPTSVHERSNIVIATIPPNDSGVFAFPSTAVEPEPTPTPTPTPPLAPSAPGEPVDTAAILARIDTLEHAVRAAVRGLDERLNKIAEALEKALKAID